MLIMSDVVGHFTEFPPRPGSHSQHAGRDPEWKGMTYRRSGNSSTFCAQYLL